MFVLPEIVRSPSLAETAKQLIQEAIWSGQLAPGVHLVEASLAEQFQISRGPFREALRSLAAEGLVEFFPGRGAFVANPTSEQMQDMIALRAMLGGMAARYAASKGDAEMVGRLSRHVAGMRSAAEADDEKTFFDEQWAFYEILHRSANEFIFRSWQSLHGLINVYVRRLGRPFVSLQSIIVAHECFIKTVVAGDPDEAEAVVRSEMLRIGFIVLDRPLSPMLASLVTRVVLEDATAIPFDPKARTRVRLKLASDIKSSSGGKTSEHALASPNRGRARRAG